MDAQTILLIDDDPIICRSMQRHLSTEGFNVLAEPDAEKGLAAARANPVSLALIDINLPGMSGEKLIQLLHAEMPSLPLVVLTSYNDTSLAVRCIRSGASDFLTKPCEETRVSTTVRNVIRSTHLEQRLREIQEGLDPSDGFGAMYGRSAVMRKVFEQLAVVAKSDISVLICGASGTGKELVARALHNAGPRKAGPFLAINCGAIPETMLESELFGHEKGAFTGAISAHPGCFEQCDKGTLFLDEIGEMRLDMQVRLLRVLETHEVKRLGGTRNIQCDVRVLAATNKDLKRCITEGSFRSDLFFRLAAYSMRLPALAERENDVLELAERFVVELAAKSLKTCTGIDRFARDALQAYAWPGNVRELRNVIERAVLLSRDGMIHIEDLPEEVTSIPAAQIPAPGEPVSNGPETILPMVEEERRIFQRAIRLSGGDISKASVALGIGRATLYRRIKELNLQV